MRRLHATEFDEQKAVIDWCRLALGRYPELGLLYHVANGGSRNKAEAARLKAAGVKSGVPDLCLPIPRQQYHGLYIEMKANGGKPSPEQLAWIEALNQQGYAALVCRGAEVAIRYLEDYLRLEK